MIKLAAFALLLTSTTAGCILGCSGYNGDGDRMFMRDADSLMLCENGGFVVAAATGNIEGRLITNTTTGVISGVEGDDGATVFTLDDDGNGTVDTTGLGTAAWIQVDLDQTALDHADVQCTDLTTRAWWPAS